MLLLRTLFAMFVLTMTSAAARVVDIKFDPSLEMPPLPEEPHKFETYTIHSCLESLENDPNVAFSADQVLSNEEDFPWASQGWSKVSEHTCMEVDGRIRSLSPIPLDEPHVPFKTTRLPACAWGHEGAPCAAAAAV